MKVTYPKYHVKMQALLGLKTRVALRGLGVGQIDEYFRWGGYWKLLFSRGCRDMKRRESDLCRIGCVFGGVYVDADADVKLRHRYSLESRISNHLEASNRRSSFQASHVDRNCGIRARTLNRLPHLDRGSI